MARRPGRSAEAHAKLLKDVETHTKTLRDVEQRHAAEVEDTENSHASHLSDVHKRHSEAISRVEERHAAEVEALVAEHTARAAEHAKTRQLYGTWFIIVLHFLIRYQTHVWILTQHNHRHRGATRRAE